MKGRRAIVAVLVIAIVVAGAVVALDSEEIAHGRHLLPYSSGEVSKLRVAGAVTVYVEHERHSAEDVLNSAVLMSIAPLAAACVAGGWVPRDRRTRRFYLSAAVGTAALAADEVLAVHETVGHNLRFLSGPPGIEHPDDAIVLLYAVVAALFVVVHRDLLTTTPVALGLFGAAAVGAALAALADIPGLPYEEQLEVLVSALALAGFSALAGRHVGEAGLPATSRRHSPAATTATSGMRPIGALRRGGARKGAALRPGGAPPGPRG